MGNENMEEGPHTSTPGSSRNTKDSPLILVVEDSPVQAMLLERILLDAGYRVAVGGDGSEGLAMARREKPAMVISDITMPVMNGFEMCRAIKEDEALLHIPVILLTSLTDTRDVIRALDAGADAYINKPYDTDLLLCRIAFVMDHPSPPSPTGDREKMVAILDGEEHQMTAHSSQKMLNFLIFTYENTIRQNRELVASQESLKELNEHLEEIVASRTAVLNEEINERKLAEEKIANYAKQLELSVEGTLQVVTNMVEQRDPYTAGHERRVGIIAEGIAREMGWPEGKCKELQLIGLVHDIGKIGIPAEILVKPTHLSDNEYNLVKAHAENGYTILKGVEYSLPIAEIIYQHHERMDGSGYPRGLKGEEILLEARVIAVADVLEAIPSHRPYRPSLGIMAALQEITEHRGTLYDAVVVDAALGLMQKTGYQLPS